MTDMLYEALEEAPSPESKCQLFIILSGLFIIMLMVFEEGHWLIVECITSLQQIYGWIKMQNN